MNPVAKHYVYAIFRPDGRPCYIGKGTGSRMRRHFAKARNRHLAAIIRQSRERGLVVRAMKVGENLTEEAAFEMEKFFIKIVGRKAGGGPLVNLTEGGDGPRGFVMPHDVRHKIRLSLKGKKKTEAHVAASALGQKGCKKSHGWWSTEEGRAKQKQNNRGNTGNKHSLATRSKISESLYAHNAIRPHLGALN